MKKRCGIVIMLLALATLLLATVPATAPATVSLNSYEAQLVKLINQKRAKKGLHKLRVNAKLVRAARSHSTDMGENKYFDHNCPTTGETWSARIIRFGYSKDGCSYWKAGENIYCGAQLFSSPVAAFQAWMKSSAHRKVILTKSFRDIGVGAVATETGYDDVEGTVWFFTLDVGRRISN